MDSAFHEDHERFQRTLMDFLKTQLSVGFVFCRDARTKRAEFAPCVENARIALETVRRFQGKIIDAQLSLEIHARADELEKLVAALEQGSV
jgi:hypothetical protein